MQVILQGSLRHFPPAELLGFLCQPGRKGTLDVEAGSRRARIFFENDTILSAQAKTGGEGLDAVLDALEWEEGTFTVLDTAVLPDGTRALALTLATVQAEAKRRAEKFSAYTDATRFHVVENPELLQQVSLEADDFKLLFKLAPGRTLGELLAELPIARNALVQRLKRLHSFGLIATGGTQDKATVPERVRVPDIPAGPEADQTQPGMSMPVPPRPKTLIGSLTSDTSPDEVFPLLDAECLIGRKVTKEVAFSINDRSVSSKHAKLTRTDEGFLIEDLDSRNGTFVNGEKVTEKRLLADGDLIRLGKVIMTFNIAREKKAGDITVPELRVD